MPGLVAAVHAAPAHSFSKPAHSSIRLLAGLGVEGDAHCGETVKHRSRVAVDPTQPNLRQVHLVHEELFAELAGKGFAVGPGDIGENVTTRGLDLLNLPRGTRLRFGSAEVEVAGLRNPCAQLDAFQPGLMRACLGRDAEGRILRKAGIMAVVTASGTVEAGAVISVHLPPEPHLPLERV